MAVKKRKRPAKKNEERWIKNWPEDERPREKLFKSGEHVIGTLASNDLTNRVTDFLNRVKYYAYYPISATIRLYGDNK